MRDIKFRFFCEVCNEYVSVYEMKFFSDGALAQCPNHNAWTDTVKEQLTGLQDKNGVDIYEGDVIHYDGYGDYIITWDADSGCWDTDLIGPCHELFMSTNLFELSTDPKQESCEVIGNIHENKELLK